MAVSEADDSVESVEAAPVSSLSDDGAVPATFPFSTGTVELLSTIVVDITVTDGGVCTGEVTVESVSSEDTSTV